MREVREETDARVGLPHIFRTCVVGVNVYIATHACGFLGGNEKQAIKQ